YYLHIFQLRIGQVRPWTVQFSLVARFDFDVDAGYLAGTDKIRFHVFLRQKIFDKLAGKSASETERYAVHAVAFEYTRDIDPFSSGIIMDLFTSVQFANLKISQIICTIN